MSAAAVPVSRLDPEEVHRLHAAAASLTSYEL